MRLLGILTGLILILIPNELLAIAIDANAPCLDKFLLCNADLTDVIKTMIQTKASLAFGGFLFAMFVFYAIQMLFATGDENALTDVRKSISYAIFGVILVAGAGIISNGLTVGFTGGNIVDTVTLSDEILVKIKDFVIGLAGISLIIMITYQGFRLNLAEDESQSSAARKRFLEGLIGAAVINLVNPIVNAFIPSSRKMGDFTNELAGIARFLATIFGALAIIAIVIGGMMLVVSVQDSMKERGRQIIFGSIISLIVVWASYSIIRTIII